ncbi:glycoside hydrolase family protein [Rhizobium straminoryzae]|uniref:Lysozyme n=1 Tax=Rhizobium straminoryzae TaxID=1387186 RepID=A0A549T0T9_9HYPH|nr:peptidoglycan-binding protein [Rhizobium straminoryzae]TRL35481.1 peptidoglycan-binding protein [Rhizobium straminoryzae]
MSVTAISQPGKAFVRLHEGNVLTCYLDSRKIPTIGTGFTMRSESCRREFARIGITQLVPGKTKLTTDQSDAILDAVMAAEFVPAVIANSPEDRKQHQLDAAASAVFNLGTGAMQWEWARLWRAGRLQEAANYLATHYNTAGGKRLAGLVRRRQEEALLFAKGIYTGVADSLPEGAPRQATAAPTPPDPVVQEAQDLLTSAGFNPGGIDGWMGERTKAAVIAYQRAHPHLVADGIIGTATLTQLRRDAAAAREAIGRTAASGLGSAVTAWLGGLPWGWFAAAAMLIALTYVAYRNRDLLVRRWNTWHSKLLRRT